MVFITHFKGTRMLPGNLFLINFDVCGSDVPNHGDIISTTDACKVRRREDFKVKRSL